MICLPTFEFVATDRIGAPLAAVVLGPAVVDVLTAVVAVIELELLLGLELEVFEAFDDDPPHAAMTRTALSTAADIRFERFTPLLTNSSAREIAAISRLPAAPLMCAWHHAPSFVDKESGMHAAITTVSIDAGKETEARALLSSQIVPMVKQAPGFIAGYWTEPKADKGFSVVIFDSEESARAALPAVGFRAPGSPVVIESVEFREVIESA